MSTLRVENGKNYKNQNISLDGISFVDCTFESCNIYYSGCLFDAIDCNWIDNNFHFEDAAWRTAAFFHDRGWLQNELPFVITHSQDSKSN